MPKAAKEKELPVFTLTADEMWLVYCPKHFSEKKGMKKVSLDDCKECGYKWWFGSTVKRIVSPSGFAEAGEHALNVACAYNAEMTENEVMKYVEGVVDCMVREASERAKSIAASAKV